MKSSETINCVLGLIGVCIVLIFQNVWGYIPCILIGIAAVFFIRKKDETDVPKKAIKTRNIISICIWVMSAILCYLFANEALKQNFLWLLLSAYIFLTVHGVLLLPLYHSAAKKDR